MYLTAFFSPCYHSDIKAKSRVLQFFPVCASHSTKYLPYQIIYIYFLLPFTIHNFRAKKPYICVYQPTCSLNRHIDFSDCRKVKTYALTSISTVPTSCIVGS